jgi:hypothetical protein
MSFFKNFPTRQFNLNETGELINVKDIFRHVDVDDLAIDPFTSYTYYEIASGERPDVVSQKLYGTTDFYWTFFIVNDFLKEGLGAWPKSEQELERYIAEQYDNHSILEILPGIFDDEIGLRTIESLDPQSTVVGYYYNTFLGLDLSHDYLRIRRKNSNAYALIHYFDPDLFQLHIHKIQDVNNFFNFESTGYRGETTYIIETYNPYHAQNPLYEEVEQLNDAWLEKALAWAEEGYPSGVAAFNNNFYETNTGINFSRREYLRAFESYVLGGTGPGTLSWKTSALYLEGRNAPVNYTDTATGDPMTAYDVYRGPYTLPNGETRYGPYATLEAQSTGLTIQSRYDLEVEKNFERRQIKVVKKSQIQAFAEAYKKLIR